MTTATMIEPSTIAVTFGSMASSVRSVRTEPQHEDGDDRAEQVAPAAAERDAAKHDRRDAGEQIGAGDRRADAGAHGERQAAHRGEQAGEGVGEDLGARDRDAAAEGRELVGADGVD